MSKTEQFFSLLYQLNRNYGQGVSTFGACSTDGCKQSGRGSGRCADCCEREIAVLINDGEVAFCIRDYTRKASEAISEAVFKLENNN